MEAERKLGCKDAVQIVKAVLQMRGNRDEKLLPPDAKAILDDQHFIENWTREDVRNFYVAWDDATRGKNVTL